MGQVLVLLVHPNLERSRVNRTLADAIRDLAGVTVRDLYGAWPDGHIDRAVEQALVERHHALVWQHPLYWYSTPSLLKEWQDQVLTPGWAYGRGGEALRGKPFFQAISTGGPEAAYLGGMEGRASLDELLSPVRQTGRLCGWQHEAPFVVHAADRLSAAALVAAGNVYRERLSSLVRRLDVASEVSP